MRQKTKKVQKMCEKERKVTFFGDALFYTHIGFTVSSLLTALSCD